MFECFLIRQWAACYTLEVRYQHPGMGRTFTREMLATAQAADRENVRLAAIEFATLEDVIVEIKRLELPRG